MHVNKKWTKLADMDFAEIEKRILANMGSKTYRVTNDGKHIEELDKHASPTTRSTTQERR